ncbi:hypothetical protein JTE90_010622 [Oedothorax gibbosus]|uniref:LRRCT domain-containing protein n=1 Tax=Oedothorax gibbosus TaxID=931172 RepID=A0AAV6VIM9_9ARAC|nr:hypothetical protein JTE90_010622 [Oedothorax gibbosus]
MKSFPATVVLLLFGLLKAALAEWGCPEPEDVLPCECTMNTLTYLECRHVDDPEVLRTVFQKSANYEYNEVHLEYSSLQYLPHDMFEAVQVNELHLLNVTLNQLFDSPPEALDQLNTLLLKNTRTLRGNIWELLKPLKSLESLMIYTDTVKKLGKDFSENAPKGLQRLTFEDTQTKKLEPGVFKEFPNLNMISINANKLEHLQRDILPVPWYGKTLHFNHNKLSEIPDDMFTQMPNLTTLGLNFNQIAAIPESAFYGTDNLENLLIDGNPIKCDCRLRWIYLYPQVYLRGKCESPKKLHGKELRDVTLSDFVC